MTTSSSLDSEVLEAIVQNLRLLGLDAHFSVKAASVCGLTVVRFSEAQSSGILAASALLAHLKSLSPGCEPRHYWPTVDDCFNSVTTDWFRCSHPGVSFALDRSRIRIRLSDTAGGLAWPTLSELATECGLALRREDEPFQWVSRGGFLETRIESTFDMDQFISWPSAS